MKKSKKKNKKSRKKGKIPKRRRNFKKKPLIKKVKKIKRSKKISKKIPKSLRKNKSKNFKKSLRKIKIKPKETFVSKIVRLQFALKPNFNFNFSINIEKYIQSFFDKTKTYSPPDFSLSQIGVNPNFGEGIPSATGFGPIRPAAYGALTNPQEKANIEFGKAQAESFGQNLTPFSAKNGVLDWGLKTRHQFSSFTSTIANSNFNGTGGTFIPVSYASKVDDKGRPGSMEAFSLNIYNKGTDAYLDQWMDTQKASVDGLNSPMSGHGSDTRNPLSPLSPTTM